MLKVIVAGGREFNDYALLSKTLDYLKKPFEVVCGEARGADALGKRYATEHNLTVHNFPADWNKHGKSAGYKRNEQMADFADAVISFWDGQSRGTKHMIDIATRKGLKCLVVRYTK